MIIKTKIKKHKVTKTKKKQDSLQRLKLKRINLYGLKVNNFFKGKKWKKYLSLLKAKVPFFRCNIIIFIFYLIYKIWIYMILDQILLTFQL